jgi:predicted dehydrogenase
MTPLPRIAVVGCGAIAEAFHIPALASDPAALSALVLVDPDLERASALSRTFGTGGGVFSSLDEVVGQIDGAVVTAPHSLHYPLCRTLLDHGVAVLCEKPLTTDLAEAEDLVARAEAGGIPFAVNQTRRLYPSHRKIREMIQEGALGALRRVVCFEGEVFDWPAASGTYFGRASGGHGVILDRGAHQVDLLCWWLGEGELLECLHDSTGGSEATASLKLRFGSVEAEVHLSWLAKFPNNCTIQGERGGVELGIYEQDRFRVTGEGGRPREVRVPGGKTQVALAGTLLSNFIQVLREGAAPLIPAADVLPSLRILDACYRTGRNFDEPWLMPAFLEESDV